MNDQTIIALRNYDWLIRNRGLDNVSLHLESDALVWGDDGGHITALCEPGFTPATDPGMLRGLVSDASIPDVSGWELTDADPCSSETEASHAHHTCSAVRRFRVQPCNHHLDHPC
jgi:hypothetical protein